MSRKNGLHRPALALLASVIAALAPAAANAAPMDTVPPAEVERPQTPRAPFPYAVEEVSFAGAGPDVVLAGSLTWPRAGHSLPAVVLVHGSGLTDRDSTYQQHKPLLVLADALTRAGYAVLRYDKRGVGQSSGDFRAATTLDFAGDAAAAMRYLRTRSEIDSKRVGMVGHSEGGTIVALLSASSDPPAASVSLNGMIAPNSEQLPLQEVLTGKDLGANDEYAVFVNAYYARLMDGLLISDDAERLAHMSALASAWQASFPPGHINHAAAGDSLLNRPKLLASRWLMTLMQLDVPAAIRQGKAPILIANGSTDRQVVAAPNLQVARAALGTETPQRRTQLLPGLNHVLQESESGASDDYGTITQTVSPIATDAVIEFLCLTIGRCQQ
ncbi:MAG: alpha/beta fold hydrolase [Pseudomonadota bacterium]|nr:alpha/beta fold hydrolase [Pseudomonadota bacterium]